MEFELAQATPEVVARKLQTVPRRGAAVRQWADLLTDRQYVGRLGEVMKPSDWEELPLDEPIRIVSLMINGQCVIRWATTVALVKTQRAPLHEYLFSDAETTDDVRSGYVVVTSGRRLQIN